MFDSILCAVDGSDESVHVVGWVDRLAPADRKLLIVTVVEPIVATSAAGAAVIEEPGSVDRGFEIVDRAREAAQAGRDTETRVLEGPPAPGILDQIEQEGTTLVTIGVHERHRLAGILGGSVGTSLIHSAPCAVLAWRDRGDGATSLPRSVVVGVDGSDASIDALGAAQQVAAASGAQLTAYLSSSHGHDADVDETRAAVEEAAPTAEIVVDDRNPVGALSEWDADLVAVGSRRVRGIRSLGSVSERVAHKASAPVLVVR